MFCFLHPGKKCEREDRRSRISFGVARGPVPSAIPPSAGTKLKLRQEWLSYILTSQRTQKYFTTGLT